MLDSVKGFSTTFRHLFQKPVTQQYPEYKRPVYPRFRGRHQLHRHDNGLEKCVGCSLCAAACPSDCIRVVPAENTPDNRVSAGERHAPLALAAASVVKSEAEVAERAARLQRHGPATCACTCAAQRREDSLDGAGVREAQLGLSRESARRKVGRGRGRVRKHAAARAADAVCGSAKRGERVREEASDVAAQQQLPGVVGRGRAAAAAAVIGCCGGGGGEERGGKRERAHVVGQQRRARRRGDERARRAGRDR